VRTAIVAALVLAIAAFATFASVPSSSPAATLESKQAQAAELDKQVSKLEEQYDELQEKFRGAQYELDQVRKDVDEAHAVVVATRKDLGVAKLRLAERAATIYRSGGAGDDVTELLATGTFAEFFDRIETMQRVGDQDANVLVRVEALNRQVAAKERVLKRAKARAQRAAAKAERARKKMGAILDARQDKLDSVNADIRAILEERRRQAAARAAAAAQETASLAEPDETPSGGGSFSSGGGSIVPIPPGSSTASAAASIAMGKIGSPYVWAAAGPDSFDCSGLVVWSFAQAGRPGLPHSTYSLIGMGVEVPMDQLQVGDLVFSSSIGHVGIYVGNGSFVHAPHSGDVVKVTSLGDYGMARARRL
jgi:cell wall-associated NlpC family hydrolase